ncbi:protein CUSTOS [Puntigrus tetrazona]|uniref:protein CUSTOS n=1 Tax=Puntigrus tetrazona TaxID=1606681 RepID=UPI001C8903EF|nr:protein CUSTOS [Puntigrus tetrazona]
MSGSSSEDENTDRLKEAVWSFGAQGVKLLGNGGASCPHYEDGNIRRESRRTDVSKHEHDGNELGTTPEFQSHVAKKLGALLDGHISEVFTGTVDSKHDQSKNEEEEDEGSFHLFSTSAPGNWMEEPLPPPPKRRRVPSSSDSDSEKEMRFREAAVSGSDIIASAAQFLREEEKSATKEPAAAQEVTVAKKKKKKKKKKIKASTERSDENNTQVSEKLCNGEGTEEQTPVVQNPTKKKKKKKKKKRKLDEGKIDCDE